MQHTPPIGLILTAIAIFLGVPCLGYAGESLQKCFIPSPFDTHACCRDSRQGPTCGIELTCTDKPVQLGYSDGVCFRATCAGIWMLSHKRADQASFRRRSFTYRHYTFAGVWEVKDQGTIESAPTPIRELFLVLPEDLIELKLRDPDPNAAVEVVNLGYLKKGSIDELKRWLAHQVYLERPKFRSSVVSASVGATSCGYSDTVLSPGRLLGQLLGVIW